jgi:hypothetical protein
MGETGGKKELQEFLLAGNAILTLLRRGTGALTKGEEEMLRMTLVRLRAALNKYEAKA